jgi:hypothetical protein
MAKTARQLETEEALTPEQRELIEEFRARVRALGLAPMTDEQLAACKHRRANAEVSSAIEGLTLSAADRAFFDMLDEERAQDVGDDLIIAFSDALWNLEHPEQR